MQQDLILLLLIKKLTGQASATELSNLNDLLAGDPDMAKQARILSDYWKNESAEKSCKTSEAFSKISQRLKKSVL